MLELSALENQKILNKMERLSFSSLVKAVAESKQAILSKKDLQLAIDVPDQVMVNGDRFLLHQALSNLVQNAIDFSPANSHIKLDARVLDKLLIVSVEDNGPGIPGFATRKVFDKFFSLQRPDSDEKSTGLGLNFVKEVITLHNGDIILENRTEKGVRATLMLPL